MTTYRINRKFKDHPEENHVVIGGLSLDEAQEHCSDKETSSSTCTEPDKIALTKRFGPWFDSYTEE